MGSWHEAQVRVRFEETDMMGVVYYSKFLVWFEVGRVSLLRDKGLPYKELSAEGIGLPIVQAHADYQAPARFDDELLVKTRIKEMGTTSVTFENEVYRLPGRELLCTGHTVHVVVGKDGRPMPIPEALRARLSA
jgi:acyl-CoA thioester hydrolase